MDTTTTSYDASGTIICAKPGCENTTTPAESGYIDGCGRVCPGCFGPDPEWCCNLEPPF